MEMYYKETKLADMSLLMSDMNLGIYEFDLVLDEYYERDNPLFDIRNWLNGQVKYESLGVRDEIYFLREGNKFICDFTVFKIERHNSQYITGGVEKIIANIVGLSLLSFD